MLKRNSLVIGIVVLVIAASTAGIFFFVRQKPTPDAPSLARVSLPDVTLKDLDGHEIRLSDIRGKPAVISLWASWCPLCKDQLKQLETVQRNGVVFIAINRGESAEQVRQVVQELGIGSTTLMLLDNDDMIYQTSGGFAMPETFFVDKSGKVRERQLGLSSVEALQRRVQDLKKLSTDL